MMEHIRCWSCSRTRAVLSCRAASGSSRRRTRGMPKRGQADHSPGDRRRPFSDAGGPGGRHAQTHDVRLEKATNPAGEEPDPADDPTFARDLDPESPAARIPAERIKRLHARLDELTDAELERLSVLEAGARLRQGSVYLDLTALEAGPFVAGGGQAAKPGRHLISKAETDHELWNRLTG